MITSPLCLYSFKNMHQIDALFVGIDRTEYFQRRRTHSSASEDTLCKEGGLSAYATFVEENVQVGQQQLRIALWNPSGQEDYENLRKISLQTVDCIIFAFSVRSQTDLQLLKSYYRQVRNSGPTKTTKIFLLPKQCSGQQQLQSALQKIDAGLSSDPHTLTLPEQSNFLAKVGLSLLASKQRSEKRKSGGCSCELY